MISWLLALALAAPPEADALLAEARRRAVVGDYEGTQIVALEALDMEMEGPQVREARYLLALGLEYAGQPDEALGIYDELLADTKDPDQLAHLRFRRAEALGRAGRYEEALVQLQAVGDASAHPPSDQVKIELLRGLWTLELPTRQAEREALVRIRDTLEIAAPIDAPHHQAMARHRLAELAAGQAAQIEFRGAKRKKARRLEDCARLVNLASDQIVPMLSLQTPYWTLQTFLVAGRAYEQFGAAMLEESKVRGLNRDQRAYYLTERRQRVEGVWVRASRYYDRGLQYAETVGWEGPETDALRQALADVVARVDTLAAEDAPKAWASR